MMRRITFSALITLSLLNLLAVRAESAGVEALLHSAATSDQASAEAAIAKLRSGGPATLAKLLEIRDKLATSSEQPSTAKLDAIIDRVGGARYCTASRLFWHTDLAAAQAASKESGKPILSLRMMGNLTDEFSCANSRFFRTSLYANEDISGYLRKHYVLHWKSVRPVPKVTIDFGDGRKLERTLTGNSIHYVLSSNGDPIDALPGLYGPQAFQKWLREMKAVAQEFERVSAADRPEVLKMYHSRQLENVVRAWEADLKAVAEAEPAPQGEPNADLNAAFDALKADARDPGPGAGRAAAPPRADAAAEIARPKALLEMPMIRAVASIPRLEKQTDEVLWEKIAALHSKDAKLDQASVRLIRGENPTAARAGKVAETKRRVEDPVIRLVSAFQSSIALDTVRNEYLLHRKLHQWYIDKSAGTDIEKLNDRVYAELFLTPKTDPWIGLVPENTYTALENGGVVREAAK